MSFTPIYLTVILFTSASVLRKILLGDLWKTTKRIFQVRLPVVLYRITKYKLNTVKRNSVDFIKL
jgi:hypothetical protein